MRGSERQRKTVETRPSSWWAGVAVALVLSVCLLVFALQNLQSVEVRFFGAKGRLPLVVALVAAAVAGALLVLMITAVRMTQLRRHGGRRRSARPEPDASTPPGPVVGDDEARNEPGSVAEVVPDVPPGAAPAGDGGAAGPGPT